MLPDQLYNLDCQIILANTYHLGIRPVSRNVILKFKLNEIHVLIIILIFFVNVYQKKKI